MPEVSSEQFARIELLLLDVDGVLTDGSVNYTDDGHELKTFHVRDGSAIKAWQRSGKRVAILSGRSSPAVNRRASELGIELVIQGSEDKLVALRRILTLTELDAEQVCAIGDDLPDVPLLTNCGLGIAVADAVRELKDVADHETSTPGGRGAVREAIEWLMRGQGSWAKLVVDLQNRKV